MPYTSIVQFPKTFKRKLSIVQSLISSSETINYTSKDIVLMSSRKEVLMEAGKSFSGHHNNDALLFVAWEILRSIALWETKSKNYEIVSTNNLRDKF